MSVTTSPSSSVHAVSGVPPTTPPTTQPIACSSGGEPKGRRPARIGGAPPNRGANRRFHLRVRRPLCAALLLPFMSPAAPALALNTTAPTVTSGTTTAVSSRAREARRGSPGGLASGLLSGTVSMTGDRVPSDGSSDGVASRVTVGGRGVDLSMTSSDVGLGSAVRGGPVRESGPIVSGRRGASGPGFADRAVEVEGKRARALSHSGAPGLSLGRGDVAGVEAEGTWTVWGRGSGVETDAEEALDGSLSTGWTGVDGRAGDGPVAGVAVSLGRGVVSYRFGAGDGGEGETTLTTMYPYARPTTERDATVWAMVGTTAEAGRREVRHDSEEHTLNMQLGALGVRVPVMRTREVEWALKADARYARRAADGEAGRGTGGLEAEHWRARLGMEVRHGGWWFEDAGVSLAPFATVSRRRDGGDGVDGTGLEVEAGMLVKVPKARFELEGRGHWLGLDTDTGYGEHGLSVEARMSPEPGSRGLSWTLGPRWGAPPDTGALWDDEAPEAEQSDTPSMSAWVGYGIGIGPPSGVVTPYLELETEGGESWRRRVGTGLELDWRSWERSSRDLHLTVGGTHEERAASEPESRLELELRLSF